MAVLVLAEHDNKVVKASTLNTVTAAKQLNDDVHVLVLGSGSDSVAQAAAQINGVTKVLHGDNPVFAEVLAETFAEAIVAHADAYDALLAPASTYGKNIMPRVAAKLDIQQISDIVSVESADTFRRPIYAGNAIATVQISDTKKVITVRATAFDKAEAEGGSATIEAISDAPAQDKSAFVSLEASEGGRPDLTSADIIVSGGRGVGSAENFKIIEELADKLGAAVGASRAAVDSGYVPNDYQVGQTGKIVAPDLYIAAGISGAIQHLAGMSGSKVIVAINTDADAPIFQVADYGIVADLFEVIPKLKDAI